MFHWFELRAFCHATEDEEKVVAALRAVLPNAEAQRETLEGHFGNPLVALTVRTEAAADIKEAWRRIVDALGRDDVLAGLEARIDDDAVYHLRIDKQSAYQGVIEKAGSGDAIDLRAKVEAYPKKPEVAVRVVRAFVEAL